jgi:hypothetical protein
MHIDFPDEPPVFNGADLRVEFTALVNSHRVVCAVSAEALEDHFGADSALETALLDAFSSGRKDILALCRRALEQSDGRPVVLHSGVFRIAGT